MKMTFRVTTAVDLGSDEVVVTVHGWDQAGRDKRPIREQFTLTGSIAASADYESDFYWSWVDRVEVASVPTGKAVDVQYPVGCDRHCLSMNSQLVKIC